MFISLCLCIQSMLHNNRKCLSLSDLHDSLSVIISSSFLFPKDDIITLFLERTKLYGVFHIAFLHFSLKAHLGWFHNLAVVNTASAFGLCWLVITQEQTGSYNRSDFVSLGKCMWISTVVRLVCIPSSRVKVLPYLSVLSRTCCYSFLNACPPGWSEWNPLVVLVCISLITNDLTLNPFASASLLCKCFFYFLWWRDNIRAICTNTWLGLSPESFFLCSDYS